MNPVYMTQWLNICNNHRHLQSPASTGGLWPTARPGQGALQCLTTNRIARTTPSSAVKNHQALGVCFCMSKAAASSPVTVDAWDVASSVLSPPTCDSDCDSDHYTHYKIKLDCGTFIHVSSSEKLGWHGWHWVSAQPPPDILILCCESCTYLGFRYTSYFPSLVRTRRARPCIIVRKELPMNGTISVMIKTPITFIPLWTKAYVTPIPSNTL